MPKIRVPKNPCHGVPHRITNTSANPIEPQKTSIPYRGLRDSFENQGPDLFRQGSTQLSVATSIPKNATPTTKVSPTTQSPAAGVATFFPDWAKIIERDATTCEGLVELQEVHHAADAPKSVLSELPSGIAAFGDALGILGSVYETVENLKHLAKRKQISTKESVAVNEDYNLLTSLTLLELTLLDSAEEVSKAFKSEIFKYYALRKSQVDNEQMVQLCPASERHEKDQLLDLIIVSFDLETQLSESKKKLQSIILGLKPSAQLDTFITQVESCTGLYEETLQIKTYLTTSKDERLAAITASTANAAASAAVATGYAARLTAFGVCAAHIASIGNPFGLAGQIVLAAGECYLALNANQKLTLLRERQKKLDGWKRSNNQVLNDFSETEKGLLKLEIDNVLSKRNSSLVSSIGSVSMGTGVTLMFTGVGLPVGLGFMIGGAVSSAGASVTHRAICYQNKKHKKDIQNQAPNFSALKATLKNAQSLEEVAAYFEIPPRLMTQILEQV